MEIIIILILGIVASILTIATLNMQSEINRQKGKVTEWKTKYLQDIQQEEKKKENLVRDYANLKKKAEKTLAEVEEYKSKYNEILKQNQELLLKIQNNTTAPETVEKPKVKATRKPRKKKGENE